MSVLRQLNVIGQVRLDGPHIRSIDSSVAADFDLLGGQILAGKQPLVIKGFNIVTTGAYGAAASTLKLRVADGILMHYLASESGTLFWVPADRADETLSSTNSLVSGSFTASAINFVGVDLQRSADDSTADVVQVLDANTLLEAPTTIPLGRTLNYRIVISISDFSSQPNVLPIAKVTTDANNNVVADGIVDARNLFFRLGAGGDFPDRLHTYPFPAGQKEITTAGAGDVFSGGDKSIGSFKEWSDAVMTQVWSSKGGEYWYSPTADRNVNMVWTGSPFSGGENFEFVSSNLHWKGIRFLFDNSTGSYNDVADQLVDSAGLTDIADGECIFVDLDRSQNLTGGSALVAQKGTLVSLGVSTNAGSRWIMAWRVGSAIYTRNWRYPLGTSNGPASFTTNGVVRLNATPVSSTFPVVTVTNASAQVVATGLSRLGAGADKPGAGALTIGNSADDTSIAIGHSAIITQVLGTADIATQDRAGAIAIGGTAATGLAIGRATVITQVLGTADIAVQDRAGAISIGATNGTTITLGRSGQDVAHGGTISTVGGATIGADCSVPAASHFKYAAAATFNYYISPADIALKDNAQLSWTLISDGNKPVVTALDPSLSYEIAGQARIPAGATVTGIAFAFSNNQPSGTITNQCKAQCVSYSGTSTPTITTLASTSQIVASNSTTYNAISTTPQTVPAGGFVWVALKFTPSGAGTRFDTYFIQVTYTMTNIPGTVQ